MNKTVYILIDEVPDSICLITGVYSVGFVILRIFSKSNFIIYVLPKVLLICYQLISQHLMRRGRIYILINKSLVLDYNVNKTLWLLYVVLIHEM